MSGKKRSDLSSTYLTLYQINESITHNNWQNPSSGFWLLCNSTARGCVKIWHLSSWDNRGILVTSVAFECKTSSSLVRSFKSSQSTWERIWCAKRIAWGNGKEGYSWYSIPSPQNFMQLGAQSLENSTESIKKNTPQGEMIQALNVQIKLFQLKCLAKWIQVAKVLNFDPLFCNSIFRRRAILPAAIFWWHKKYLVQSLGFPETHHQGSHLSTTDHKRTQSEKHREWITNSSLKGLRYFWMKCLGHGEMAVLS